MTPNKQASRSIAQAQPPRWAVAVEEHLAPETSWRVTFVNELERATYRSNMIMLICGLVCSIGSAITAAAIWALPYPGPDLRSLFCLFLVPGSLLGVGFTLWGACGVRAAKKKAGS